MKKKGFTLVELLGVILILALLALLITPVVTGIIRSSRTKSNDAQKQLIIDAAKLWVTDNDTKLSSTTGSEYKLFVEDIQKGGYLSDTQIVDIEKEVSIANACVVIKTTEKKFEYEFVDTCSKSAYANGTPIYFNPETGKICTETEATANVTSLSVPTNIKTGCMKWYAFNDTESSTTLSIILDHNTTAIVAWNSTGTNTSMGEVSTSLTTDTATWMTNLNPRLITANEVADIVGATTALKWDSNKTYGEPAVIGTNASYFFLDGASGTDSLWQTKVKTTIATSDYSWLFDYTNGCTSRGCSSEDNNSYSGYVYAYWTSTPRTGITTYAWYVHRGGSLASRDFKVDSASAGVRPVITIPKSLFD